MCKCTAELKGMYSNSPEYVDTGEKVSQLRQQMIDWLFSETQKLILLNKPFGNKSLSLLGNCKLECNSTPVKIVYYATPLLNC